MSAGSESLKSLLIRLYEEEMYVEVWKFEKPKN
jgi:hypothetical protein